jgi:tRNA (guanine37-N1)-methyltransferase
MNKNCKLHATIITIFPEMFPGPLGFSLSGKALRSEIWNYKIVDLKDFGLTSHKNVDDKPYGGGDGLVIRPDVLGNAIDYAIEVSKTKNIYYMSPRGKLINQTISQEVIDKNNIIIICGRFAGIDERVIEAYKIEELSLGDFILSGGEIACYALLDSCIRLLDGVINNYLSSQEDSFGQLGSKDAILEYPLYTKPRIWQGFEVPDVLLSGDHSAIKNWKIAKSIEVTKIRRPDLLNK